MTRRQAWSVAAMLLVVTCAPACAATIRGTLFVPRSSHIGDAVVWLEKVPDRVERDLARGRKSWFFGKRTPPPPAKLVARRQRYEPRVVVVAVGDTLIVHNEDRLWHGPFSVSPARPFELGKIAPGTVDSVRFDKPGQVQVRCDIHPGMSATVLVTPNHAFVRPDAAGEWKLPSVPPGEYVVRAWAPGLRELRKPATVRRGEAVVQIHW